MFYREFFAGYARDHPELGIDISNIQDEMGWDKPRVHVAQRMIRQIGAGEAINRYAENPLWVVEK